MTKSQQQQQQVQDSSVGRIPEMYLAIEDWSPRFQSTFFTTKMDSVQLMTQVPPPASGGNNNAVHAADVVGGKTNLPAYYYKIEVKCGHQSRTVWRRYSQFRWLYHQLLLRQQPQQQRQDEPCSSLSSSSLSFPPPTWWCQPQTTDFVQNRLEQLREFLRDVLVRRGSDNDRNINRNTQDDDPVVAFLELDQLVVVES